MRLQKGRLVFVKLWSTFFISLHTAVLGGCHKQCERDFLFHFWAAVHLCVFLQGLIYASQVDFLLWDFIIES